MAMEEEIAQLTGVLSDLKSTPDQIAKAIEQMTASFISHLDQSEERRETILSCGLLQSLLGLLTCSGNVQVLSSTAQLLAAFTHGSDRMRLEMAKLKIVKILLPLLTPHSPEAQQVSYEREWEWVPVQEQVLTVLRKVTFHCESNQAAFIRMGGAGQIIRLCCDNGRKSNYPPQTKERLQSLVVGQLLVAAVLPMMNESKKKLVPLFPVLSLLKNIDYPMYYVDLADENKAWLTDILIQEGLGVPDSQSLFKKEERDENKGVSWVVVRGMHVSGPNLVWLQYSVDKTSDRVIDMFRSLQELAPPPLPSPISLPLTLGNVYAVYVMRERAWHRGWFLQLPDKTSNDHVFFCMDYGFTLTVPLSHVTTLPQECRGVPPQAVPCLLVGISPPPKSYVILRHVTAILRNIAFERDVYRREIKVAGGVEFLFKLITSSDDDIRENAMGALLNLAHSKEVCQLLRQLGAIQALIELCITDSSSQIINLILGLLQNLLINDSNNCLEILEVYNSYDKLSKWMHERAPPNVRDNLARVLLAIETLRKGDKLISQDDAVSPLTCTPFPVSQQSLTPHAKITGLARSASALPTKATPKKQKPPMYRVLSEDRRPRSSTHSPDTPISYQSEIDSDTFVFNMQLLSATEEQPSLILFINVTDVRTLLEPTSNDHLLRTLCALGNHENGGRVYIGVTDSGIVKGLIIQRLQRDIFRTEIDKLSGSHLRPPLDGRYRVAFIPVTGGSTDELFVIHIRVLPSLTNDVHLVVKRSASGHLLENCYVSQNGGCVKLSFLEVQKLVALREMKKYEKLLSND